MRRLLLALALSALTAGSAQAQVLPGEGSCLNCINHGEGGECTLMESGANECSYIFVGEHLTCLTGGGLCGFDAVSMSGQVVVAPEKPDHHMSSGHKAPYDWIGMITSTPLRYDPVIRAYRRVCDGAVVASAALPTWRGDRTHDIGRIGIG